MWFEEIESVLHNEYNTPKKQRMQDYTILVKEPGTKTLIEIICPDEKAMDKLAKQMEQDGCKGVMAVEVMR